MRSFAALALLLVLPLAHAAPGTPATAWVGTYTTCGQSEGAAWRLEAKGTAYAVAVRNSSLENWTPDAAPAQVLDPQALAALNATGSSRDSKDQAQAALTWGNGHLLRMPAGWFDRYRQPSQTFTPDLIFTGDGQAVFLCRAK